MLGFVLTDADFRETPGQVLTYDETRGLILIAAAVIMVAWVLFIAWRWGDHK